MDDVNGILLILGHGVKGQGQIWYLSIIHVPCGHNADYSFSPITFKLNMQVVDDERKNPVNFESQGQWSRSTVALCV